MKKLFLLICGIILCTSCEMILKDNPQKEVSNKNIKNSDSIVARKPSIEEQTEALKKQGYKVFTYKEGDTTYLMQKYFMVFLKTGKNRNQDSTETANLQKLHLAHLERMAQEGYTSLTGPFGDNGEIRGIVVYNTPTQKMADSLARLDPMVKAERLTVEIHPWWTAKGSKLK
ncbi:YciI family protein [Mesonia aquimarina]|uniref:YciI family protein n=1 Tax=Mesonia aquimarina TaxID=1504967 RepID=UPI000EF5EB0E|nr:hypothetical protein [Mesonia aquimarina]